MTPDVISPKKGITEYKNELVELLDLQKHFLDGAKEQADKGFKFSADQLLSNAENLVYDIQFIEEMIEKLMVKAPMVIA